MATWADTELRFDMPYSEMSLLNGEKILDSLENIEDFKGNKGETGVIFITNLRLVWYCVGNVFTNVVSPDVFVGIGFKSITNIGSKTVNSLTKGATKALNLFAHFNSTRYEFVFVSFNINDTRLFTTVLDIYRSYLLTKMYREIKFRGAFLQNKQLRILPSETISSVVNGMWNLSCDQGCLGTFIITNIRLVWYANLNEDFNVSLPYIQVEDIRTQNSKFGLALVVKVSELGGRFILGFKTDSDEKLEVVHKEIQSRFSVFCKNPVYGVECRWQNKSKSNFQTPFVAEDFRMEDSKEDTADALSSYAASNQELEKTHVYSPELGLAIQTIKEGYTLKKLWSIV